MHHQVVRQKLDPHALRVPIAWPLSGDAYQEPGVRRLRERLGNFVSVGQAGFNRRDM